MTVQATRLADRCFKNNVISQENIIQDFDALGTALQNTEIQKCQVFRPVTLLNPTEPSEEMLVILSDPWTVIPSASVSIDQEEELPPLTEKDKEGYAELLEQM